MGQIFLRVSILVIVIFVVQASFAAMRVTPAVVELTIENNRASGSFTLANTDPASMRIRANPVHFKLDSTGKLGPSKLDSTSLGNWLKINPQEFTIEGKGERQIRFALVAPVDLPDGSYWGGIEFRPVAAMDTSKTSQIHASMAILVPVMADKGAPHYEWTLIQDSMQVNVNHLGVYVRTLLRNTGNGRIPQRGHYQLRDETGAVVDEGDTPRLSLFPGSERFFSTQIPEKVKPGVYDFQIVYTSERDESTLSGQLKITVPESLPEPPPDEKKR